jgi:endonuclease-3
MAAKGVKSTADRRRMAEILRVLKREYPEARCSLDFKNPFQLLVATMLSAQTTDERVNRVTPALFSAFPNPKAMAEAPIAEIEALVRSTNFYKNKARALKESAALLVERHGGKVPKDLDALTALRGVGRKTANVVLGNAYGVPGLVVDTHVARLSRRMGFTRAQEPEKIEAELMDLVPEEDWTAFAHLMIAHGRAICTARKALCDECPVARLCPKIGVC